LSNVAALVSETNLPWRGPKHQFGTPVFSSQAYNFSAIAETSAESPAIGSSFGPAIHRFARLKRLERFAVVIEFFVTQLRATPNGKTISIKAFSSISILRIKATGGHSMTRLTNDNIIIRALG